MRLRAPLLSIAALSLLAAPALAEDLTISGNVTLTSRYVSTGLRQTTGAAFQPSIELGYAGFYTGLWASNVSPSLLGHNAELDLSFGYRTELGPVSADLGYVRYFYTSPWDNTSGQVILNLSGAPVEGTDLGLKVAYDPDAKVSDISVSASQAIGDHFSVAGGYGRVENSHTYWSVGTSYALNDSTSVDLTWHDSTIESGIAVLSISYDFSLR